MRKMRKLVAAVLTGVMVLSMAACGKTDTKTTPSASPDPTKAPEETKKETTLVWGTHWVNGLDPHVVDEITGEPVMAADQRAARLAAEEAVYKALGVKLEYVQYDTTRDILQSELSGRPVADIATLWGGSESTILSQNVMQNLDAYEHIFREDEEMGWMLYDKLYGHYYMMSDVCRFTQRWPLVYNIDLLEKVDCENPNVLFEKGEWTWSKFKEILEKVQAAYASDDNVDAYFTDFRMATLSAAFANGANIYGANGVGVADQKMVDAVEYVNELINSNLMTYETYDGGTSIVPVWCLSADKFRQSKTVFAEVGDWLFGNDKNEAIGIVPWPRPDRLAADSPEYKQCMTVGDSICILKGVSAEKTELAIKTLMLYTKTYYCTLGGVDSYAEYQKKQGKANASSSHFDITNEKVVMDDGTTLGDLVLSAYNYITKQVAIGSDVSDLMGLRVPWDDAVGTAFTKKTSYKTYIDENIAKFSQKIDQMTALLSGSGFNDTVAPDITIEKEPIAVPVGTKLTDAIWADFISCRDAVGDNADIPVSKMEVEWSKDVSESIFATPGYYKDAFKVIFKDTAGNRSDKTLSVYVYNPNNKVAPTVTLVEEPSTVKLNTAVEEIKWAGSFVASAVDADGVSVLTNIKADLSTIDTTTAGEYNVKLTVTDFAGNAAEVTVKVVVVAE